MKQKLRKHRWQFWRPTVITTGSNTTVTYHEVKFAPPKNLQAKGKK